MTNFQQCTMAIYVLRLKSPGKLYVGGSRNPYERINQHKNSRYAAQWVKVCGGIDSILDITHESNIFYEDIITKKHMFDSGIKNVRGGSYSSPVLTYWQIYALHREFDTALHRCFKCGKPFIYGHKCGANVAAKSEHGALDSIILYPHMIGQCYYCSEHGHNMFNCNQLKKDMSRH